MINRYFHEGELPNCAYLSDVQVAPKDRKEKICHVAEQHDKSRRIILIEIWKESSVCVS